MSGYLQWPAGALRYLCGSSLFVFLTLYHHGDFRARLCRPSLTRRYPAVDPFMSPSFLAFFAFTQNTENSSRLLVFGSSLVERASGRAFSCSLVLIPPYF